MIFKEFFYKLKNKFKRIFYVIYEVCKIQIKKFNHIKKLFFAKNGNIKLKKQINTLIQINSQFDFIKEENIKLKKEIERLNIKIDSYKKNLNNLDISYLIPDHIKFWHNFYNSRQEHYKSIIKNFDIESMNEYDKWYFKGGYGNKVNESRNWIINETSITKYRGTCLDVGSGDGYFSFMLAEWFNVVGIEPLEKTVFLANEIKKRQKTEMINRVDFLKGDALKHDCKYEVVFCRAPSFFNYPIYKEITKDIFDWDRKNLFGIWKNNYSKEEYEEKVANYPPPQSQNLEDYEYAGKFREYLEIMLSMTKKYFVFILTTNPDFYGRYIGDTYNHDPEEVRKLFQEYGDCNVRIDGTNTWLVAELFL